MSHRILPLALDYSTKGLIVKYISTGGAGDAFIAFLKVKDKVQLFDEKPEWLHVESNEIVGKICNQLFCSDGYFGEVGLRFTFDCDEDYIENYRRGKWKGYTPVSSGQDLLCPLKGFTNVEMTSPFLTSLEPPEEKSWDVCVQASAGAKNNRKWLFSPVELINLLRRRGFKACLIGTDMNFFDDKDEDNLVGKLSIDSCLSVINRSQKFIGLSGLLNYYACAKKIENAHLVESEEHEKRYYHPEWKSEKIKVGSFAEVWRMI